MKLPSSTIRKASSTRRNQERGGFTLIEMMVVLTIAALVSAITFSGFQSMKSGNRRVSCQSNLIAVYQAARMYRADEGAFPYYDPDNTGGPGSAGIGLWQVYTFPDPNMANGIAAPASDAPTKRYLRNVTTFHCPSHGEHNDPGSTSLYNDSGSSFNEKYLSYQVNDEGTATYDTIRTVNQGDDGWKRQILHYNGSSRVARPPADTTIVTWCRWHRGEGGGYDNVLFYDGSVNLIPEAQEDKDGVVRPLWLREPRSKPE